VRNSILAILVLSSVIPSSIFAAAKPKLPVKLRPVRRIARKAPTRRINPAAVQALALQRAAQWMAIFNYNVTPSQVPTVKKFRATGGTIARAQALTLQNAVNFRMMTGLEELTLTHSATDLWLNHLAGCTKLRDFRMGPASKLTDASAIILGRFTQLRALCIPAAKLTDAGFQHLANLTKLELLDLTRTEIGNASLAHIAKMVYLKRLFLSFTNVTDAGLPHLYGLSNLVRLDLQGKGCSPEGIARLKAHLPSGCTLIYP